MSAGGDHRTCRSRARGAASTTAWVVAILVAILVYEEVSGDTVTRSDRQTIQAWLVGAFALLGIGLGARYALSGQLTSMLRGLARQRQWSELARVSVCTVSVPSAIVIAGLAAWLADTRLTDTIMVLMLSWCAIIPWAAVVMFVADEAAYAVPDQSKLVNRVIIRGALPVIVATSLFFSGLTASVFGPPDVVLGALAIGFVLCAALFLTLVLFRWPQRLLVRDLRR